MSTKQIIKEKPILTTITPPSYEARMFFTGPLGLWPFPIINLILALIESIRARAYPVTQPRKRITIWEITRDKEGRIISILEREVSE